jgi:hypothetical protein
MPLIHGFTRRSISKNIRKLRREGFKIKQAVAASLRTARDAARKAGKRPSWLRKKSRVDHTRTR